MSSNTKIKQESNLKIKVIDAVFLKDDDEIMGVGKMDPFTVLTLGEQKYKTKTAMN